MQNRRKCCRLPVNASRATVLVVIDGKQHSAVMADLSATGFAVLLTLKVPVVPRQVITLMNGDSNFECEVAYTEPDKELQKVGLRRVRDIPTDSLPKTGSRQSFFQETLATLNPFMFLGLALGLTTFVVCSAILFDYRDLFGQTSEWVTVNVRDLEELAANERLATESGPEKQAQLQQVLAKKRNAAAVLTGRNTVEWQQVVKQLKLSVDQETTILSMVEDPNNSSPTANNTKSADEIRTSAMAVLTKDQRSRFARLLATGPL